MYQNQTLIFIKKKSTEECAWLQLVLCVSSFYSVAAAGTLWLQYSVSLAGTLCLVASVRWAVSVDSWYSVSPAGSLCLVASVRRPASVDSWYSVSSSHACPGQYQLTAGTLCLVAMSATASISWQLIDKRCDWSLLTDTRTNTVNQLLVTSDNQKYRRQTQNVNTSKMINQ